MSKGTLEQQLGEALRDGSVGEIGIVLYLFLFGLNEIE
jgi:hypothetical protein